MTIEAEHISKSYNGKKILEDFNLSMPTDAVIAIVGPSGCGKTTFLRILLGLEQPDAGKVSLLGDYKYAYLCAGTLFQENRLCESFSAIENVKMVHKKITEETARRELKKLLPEADLEGPVAKLSGGEKRRVALVRACAVPSDMLVLDEPFTGLDQENRQRVIDYILANHGTNPVIMTGHAAEDFPFARVISLEPV